METGVYIKETLEKFSKKWEAAWDKVFFTFSTEFSTGEVSKVKHIMLTAEKILSVKNGAGKPGDKNGRIFIFLHTFGDGPPLFPAAVGKGRGSAVFLFEICGEMC